MKNMMTMAAVSVFALGLTGELAASPDVGAPAPSFSGTNSKGTTVSLDDYRGRTVVLEWTNHGCPFVQKHYGTGNMQALQKEATEDDVVWLSVISPRDPVPKDMSKGLKPTH